MRRPNVKPPVDFGKHPTGSVPTWRCHRAPPHHHGGAADTSAQEAHTDHADTTTASHKRTPPRLHETLGEAKPQSITSRVSSAFEQSRARNPVTQRTTHRRYQRPDIKPTLYQRRWLMAPAAESRCTITEADVLVARAARLKTSQAKTPSERRQRNGVGERACGEAEAEHTGPISTHQSTSREAPRDHSELDYVLLQHESTAIRHQYKPPRPAQIS